jgi:hypothetical protein
VFLPYIRASTIRKMKQFLLTISFMVCASALWAQNNATFGAIKPSWRDKELERVALREANSRAATTRCREYFVAAKIVSDNWEPLIGENGRVVGRTLHMELLAETREGGCGVVHCVFRQRRQADDTWATRLKLADMGEYYAQECE